MKAFEYAAPRSADDALKALGADGASALSGGTDLMNRMKDYVTSPSRVVDLRGLRDLAGIHKDSGGLVVGAGTKLADLLADKSVAELYPALHQATLEVGTPQIRNMATVGGNLLQRPRCWYYRNGFGLLGMKDGKSLVRAGDNRYHAIFMTDGDALFVSPSSLAVPLIALGAKATIQGDKGKRTVDIADLYQVPRSDKDRELTVAPGELLTSISIPKPRGKNASFEARQKQSHDWPIVLCSVDLELDGDTVKDGRVVIYGVAPVPWRSKDAEKALSGKKLDADSAAAAGEAAISGAKPLSMNAYKVGLTRVVVKRALLSAIGKRDWEES